MTVNHANKVVGKSERLFVLTDAEKFALYGLPDFNEAKQLEYLSPGELELAPRRPLYRLIPGTTKRKRTGKF